MDIKPFTCVDCGAVGEQPRRGRRRLRCVACLAKHARARHAGTQIRNCPTCGSTVTGAKRTYCSAACQPQRTWSERKAGRTLAACAGCGAEFPKYTSAQRWCSLACANKHKVRPAPQGLSAEARERQRLYWQEKNRRRRAAKRGGVSEPYTLTEIAVRDAFRCGLCGDEVPMAVKVPELLAPTIDHITPVSKGGDDTRANVQLAHFVCNSRKGAREMVSLME